MFNLQPLAQHLSTAFLDNHPARELLAAPPYTPSALTCVIRADAGASVAA